MLIKKQLANSIRALSIDSVEKSNSGHPGAPLGMADIAEVLWRDFMRHNPANPTWFNRDRFVLSNGHASMLLYSLLHLTGYDLSIDDLKNFRQLHSKTPGHPELGEAPGVETTTGPLGQGIANAVGMAMSEKILAERFNTADAKIIDHYTYVFCGDGCLMEGVSHEACSLAGTLGLGKLILFWDDNEISIDGPTPTWFGDNTAKRFEAYNWHVITDVDGHNSDEIAKAIRHAQAEKDKPTIICCKTTIGYGSPNKAGTAGVHGAPLGADEAKLTREKLGWEYAPFEIPDEYYQEWSAKQQGQKLEQELDTLFENYKKSNKNSAEELVRIINKKLPANFTNNFDLFIKDLNDDDKPLATRKSSAKVIEFLNNNLSELIGGSADLSESNGTIAKNSKVINHDNFAGNYIHYGVREFGMSAIMNGLALHGGLIPYGGTFLTFLDYARNAVRMSALMKQRVIYIYSHDSIGLGEDGPTHQPIEHLTMLRATPNIETWRPCDNVETAVAWRESVMRLDGPSALILTRQNLNQNKKSAEQIKDIERGAYVLSDSDKIDLIIIATGSEVDLAVSAAQKLKNKINIRVVSMPCMERFLAQDIEYQQKILPNNINKRIAIEAGASMPWYRFVGSAGKILAIDSFGVSSQGADAFNYFGFTVEHLCDLIDQI